jgi:hypothetical protein
MRCNILTSSYNFIWFWLYINVSFICWYCTGGEALCYTPESRRFKSRRGHWIFFSLCNPSSPTMALRLTQHLTEMNRRGKGWILHVRLTTSLPSVSPNCLENVGASRYPNPMGLCGLLHGYLYILPLLYRCLIYVILTVFVFLLLGLLGYVGNFVSFSFSSPYLLNLYLCLSLSYLWF